jgi:hypothetical protein
MDPSTRELVDAAQVGMLIAGLSALALAVVIGLGIRARANAGPAVVKGALVSVVLAALFPLWLVYNGIEDHFGLDSVAALLINLALFAAVGTGGGMALRRFWPSEAEAPDAQHGGPGAAG